MDKEITHVLVVDADGETTEVLTTYSKIFRESSLEIVGSAGDGFSAVRMIRSKNPDVVVLDMVKNFSEGAVVLKKLQTLGPGERPAVIALTDKSGERPCGLSGENVSVLPKAYGLKALVNKIMQMKRIYKA